MVKYNLSNEGMKERLEGICYEAVMDIWGYSRDNIPEDMKIRLNKELSVIDNLKQSVLFVLIHDMIKDLGLTSEDYAIFRGTVGNLLVSHLCGFTYYNPMDYNLSPYITFSYDGNQAIDINIDITLESRQRAICWLENNDLLEGVPEIKQSGGGVFLVPKGVDYKNMLTVLPNAKYGRECVCDEICEISGMFYELSLLDHSLNYRLDLETHMAFKTCKPETFDDLVKVYGLNCNDTWDIMEPLISSGKMTLKDVVAFRDDIYEYLINQGLSEKDSSDIAIFVGKGKVSFKKYSEIWMNMKSTMINADIPEWFISVCEKIRYLFPKAHAIGILRICQQYQSLLS